MGIDMIWEDENGAAIETILDLHDRLSHLAQTGTLSGTVCLRFLDPYGDATFNQVQVPVLIDDVKSVLLAQRDASTREHLQRVLDLAVKARGAVHTYLKFVGD